MDTVRLGDCLVAMKSIQDKSIDMIYLDPPFFTQKKHRLISRDRSHEYSFNDIWACHREYSEYMHIRLAEAKRILKDTGTIFIHCDRSANHILRLIAEEVFRKENFLSEIIWSYKRWSNSANNLTPNHQNILLFAKTERYKFNKIYTPYSETTNIDQILQKRARDDSNKSVYARTEDGDTVSSEEKKGVPLGDVWEIPFLNPKAKERTGYPTQKPIILLERIIEISTDPGDVVLDPFCGSGTTLVASKMMGRHFIGIDISPEAIQLSNERLQDLVKTESAVLKHGRSSYINADEKSLLILAGLDFIPVQRNAGIDAILRPNFQGKPIPIRVQKEGESLSEAFRKLAAAAQKKGSKLAFLVATSEDRDLIPSAFPDGIVKVITATALEIQKYINSSSSESGVFDTAFMKTGSAR